MATVVGPEMSAGASADFVGGRALPATHQLPTPTTVAAGPNSLPVGAKGQPAHDATQPMTFLSLSDVPAVPFEDLEIVSRVGKGAFADIFAAKLNGEVVAVKILRDAASSSAANAIDDLQREINILGRTQHGNILRMIGVSETPKGQLCLIVEHMDKGSLRDEYLRTGPLPVPVVKRAALSVSQGMALLHSRKILHRDLKAANILLDSLGNVKIADFGLSRLKSERIETHTCETGSYRWMAPEVISHQPYAEKADVFSFGILLWELLAGQVPYQGHTPIQAAVGVVHSSLRPPVQLNVPRDLRKLMEACWHKNPKKRPSFLDVIRRLQDDDVPGAHAGAAPGCIPFGPLQAYMAEESRRQSSGTSMVKLITRSVPRFRFSDTGAKTPQQALSHSNPTQ